MRTIVDLPEEQIQVLDAIVKDEGVSRAELVRRAVDLYLSEEKKKRSDAAVDKYYGFLKDVPDAFDGLEADEYVQNIRSEWDHRDKMYSNWAMHDETNSSYEHKHNSDKDKP